MKKCSGLEYEMWEKVKNGLSKLGVNKLWYDHPVCSGILNYKSKPISMLLLEYHDMFQKEVKKFVIEKDQKYTIFRVDRFIKKVRSNYGTNFQSIIYGYQPSIEYAYNTMSINETSYMCEVLTQLFDITISEIFIKYKAWSA
ncbi:367_t:CDS:2, partial [Dentiscutata erythropus]